MELRSVGSDDGRTVLKVGDKLGAYEIVSDFKSGGMATLYLARRVGAAGFARLVAVKVIHPHLTKDDAFVRMFVDEALLSVRIEHPNVVRVEELGEHDKIPFLVMEYVHGCSLAQLLTELARRGESMLPEVAVHVAIQILDGLHAAHETRGFDGELLGVVHRDVSPQNVLLGTNGSVKVIDFGIAKARGRGLHTTTGTVKGKFRYMSPEQSRGEPVDRRTDLFALGIVLWEMLTSRRLFDAPHDAMVIDQVRRPNVTAPSRLVPGVPEALDRAVLKTLEADRERRPATGHELRKLLSEAVPAALRVTGEEVSALVSVVMADEMRRQQEALPESVRVMLKALAPTSASGGEHPLALPPDGASATPGGGGASARELAETLVGTGSAQRRPAAAERVLGALPVSRIDQAIPPAVVTPSVVTGDSAVVTARPRRARAPFFAAAGVVTLAAAMGLLLAVRPWEEGAPRAGAPAPTTHAVQLPSSAPPSAPVSPAAAPAAPASPAPPGPAAPPSPRGDGLALVAPPVPAPAPAPAALLAPDAGPPSAPGGAEVPASPRARRRAGDARRTAPARAPARRGRGGSLVDGVPIADGFGP